MKKQQCKYSHFIIDLRPHLEDFLRHDMGCNADTPIFLSRTSDMGKFIYSHVTTCDSFPPERKCANPVKICIPVTSSNKYILNYRFLCVSRWGEEKINDYLEAEFRHRMRFIFEVGYQRKYTQKQIIEAILQHYNIKCNAVNFDAVKKADYRHNRKIRAIIYKELQSAVFL